MDHSWWCLEELKMNTEVGEMEMKKMIVIGVLAMSVLFPMTSQAGNPTCSGKVTTVEVAGNGSVYATVKGSSGTLASGQFCRLLQNAGEYTPESCKATFALLTNAHATGKEITIWFRSEKFVSCSSSWGTLWNQGLYHMRVKEN